MRVYLAVIGAHPLDAEMLGGPLAAMIASQRKTVLLAHLTDGSRNYPKLGPVKSSSRARTEALKAATILGARCHWFGYNSKRLNCGVRYRDELAERLSEWRPEIVITHWARSWHPRHRIASRLVRLSLAASGIQTALYYGENFEDLAGYVPSRYVDTSNWSARWWRALEAYRMYSVTRSIRATDHQTFPYYAYYRSVPRIRGLESGLPHAQALATARRQAPKVVRPSELKEEGKRE